jgi:hypothetical protein
MYIDAIRDGRIGDAVWACYHIYRDVEVIPGDPANNVTVLEVINNLSEEEIAEFKAIDEDGA